MPGQVTESRHISILLRLQYSSRLRDRFYSLQLRQVLRDKMKVSLTRTCTNCTRHANLRRHSYLRFARGLRYECDHCQAGKDIPVLRS